MLFQLPKDAHFSRRYCYSRRKTHRTLTSWLMKWNLMMPFTRIKFNSCSECVIFFTGAKKKKIAVKLILSQNTKKGQLFFFPILYDHSQLLSKLLQPSNSGFPKAGKKKPHRSAIFVGIFIYLSCRDFFPQAVNQLQLKTIGKMLFIETFKGWFVTNLDTSRSRI